ncbi:MAG: hypothetical protein ACRDNZ_06515 [Streptosporangiaceae bacterium]
MTAQPEITQRDLRNRSREIMDAVENGQAFTVTRDGHRIGELIPLRRRRRFVPRQEFAAMSRYDEYAERARRLDVLQRAENEFDPIRFDAEAARVYGRMTAAVIDAGRKPRHRIADLMIASIAVVEELALYTTNPSDFSGLGNPLTIVPVTRPQIPPQR